MDHVDGEVSHDTSTTLLPGTFSDDRYWLVAPLTAAAEGNLGVDSLGAERPRGIPGAECRTTRDVGCP